MNMLHKAAFALVIAGALNWGSISLLNLNLVSYLFAQYPTVEGLIYLLVGASGLVLIFTHKDSCCMCSSSCNCEVPMMGTTIPKSKKRKK